MPPIRFAVTSENVRRRSRLNAVGRQLSCKSKLGCHGPEQELRDESVPSCAARQACAGLSFEASSFAMPAATAGSAAVAGLKMKARSLRAPSPLMSALTIGVNGEPDVSRAIDVISKLDVSGCVMVKMMLCFRPKALGAHSDTFGLPAVVVEKKPPAAPPKPREL